MTGFLHRLGSSQKAADDPIIEHLRVLLNTNTGSAVTVPDYGIVDFTAVVHDIPGSIHLLEDAIRDTINAYEPRLKNVAVRFAPGNDPLKLGFTISARLTDDPRRTLTVDNRLNPGGRFSFA